jgi:hypothetical protein
VRVGGFFGVTFGGKTLFQIEDIPKNGFWIIVMSGSLEVKLFFKQKIFPKNDFNDLKPSSCEGRQFVVVWV